MIQARLERIDGLGVWREPNGDFFFNDPTTGAWYANRFSDGPRMYLVLSHSGIPDGIRGTVLVKELELRRRLHGLKNTYIEKFLNR